MGGTVRHGEFIGDIMSTHTEIKKLWTPRGPLRTEDFRTPAGLNEEIRTLTGYQPARVTKFWR